MAKTPRSRDDAVFFREREEVGGGEFAVGGMIPSKQGFEARDRAILKTNDRLEQHANLSALERLSQIRFKRGSVGPTCAHAGTKRLDAIAAELFGARHGDFSVPQHIVAPKVNLRVEQRNADRGGDRDAALAEVDRRRQRPSEGVGEVEDGVGGGLRQEDDRELIAGDSAKRVLRFDQSAQPPRKGQQDRVAGRPCRGTG